MRHRFHSICPYFAMFPELFVQKHLVWSQQGDTIFDPFSGRGTTVFESLLNGRQAYGCDTNSVAVCLSNAKADSPTLQSVKKRLQQLREYYVYTIDPVAEDEFFKYCFHPETLSQLLYLKRNLKWERSRSDCFIAALVLGSLHGESEKSKNYFSNQMPRTISTKPRYSVKWWKERGLIPPERDVFDILEYMIDYRYASKPSEITGKVVKTDSRHAAKKFPKLKNRVSLVITSPPYLDVTSFEEDQWLRLWFLGGNPYPKQSAGSDDRHQSQDKYWLFLKEVWTGMGPLLKDGAQLVIRIGGKDLTKDELKEGLTHSLKQGLLGNVSLLEERTSEIIGGQRRTFKPNSKGLGKEHDFRYLVS